MNYAEKPKKGPGKKTKKQPPPKFPAKLLAKGEKRKNSEISRTTCDEIFIYFRSNCGRAEKAFTSSEKAYREAIG